MGKRISVLGAALLFMCLGVVGQESTHYAETITAVDLRTRLEILASDTFEGRETGQVGQKKAAAYLMEQFRSFGYQPLPQLGGYYQTYRLKMTYPDTVSLVIDGDSLRFLKEMYYFPVFGDMQLSSNSIRYLGYGIKSTNYDDYGGAVDGEVIMISSGEPIDKSGRSWITGSDSLSAWTSDWTKKVEQAQKSGVRALLIIDDKFQSSVVQFSKYINRPEITVGDNAEGAKSKMPVIYISSKIANQILQKAGIKNGHKQLEKLIGKKGSSVIENIDVSFNLKVKKHTEDLAAENVLAYLEGTDKKDELVVVTAHYDHLGKKGDKIYYGADDDGSGTSGLLEMAEAFAKAKKDGRGPRRSMLFMAVSGEEKGLLGSEYYTDHPVFPLASTVVDLNIDMIGRIDKEHAPDSNYVYIIGSDKLSTELHAINEQMNSTHTLLELDYTYNDERDPNRFYYRSDHYNFAKNGIPVVFYFTGVHEDYHQPTDTVDKIMFQKTEKIVRLIFHTAWELANREERIKVDVINTEK